MKYMNYSFRAVALAFLAMFAFVSTAQAAPVSEGSASLAPSAKSKLKLVGKGLDVSGGNISDNGAFIRISGSIKASIGKKKSWRISSLRLSDNGSRALLSGKIGTKLIAFAKTKAGSSSQASYVLNQAGLKITKAGAKKLRTRKVRLKPGTVVGRLSVSAQSPQPSYQLVGGNTDLIFDPNAAAAFQAAGVTLVPELPVMDGETPVGASFPVLGGTLSHDYSSMHADHDGAINLAAGDPLEVVGAFSNPQIDILNQNTAKLTVDTTSELLPELDMARIEGFSGSCSELSESMVDCSYSGEAKLSAAGSFALGFSLGMDVPTGTPLGSVSMEFIAERP
jgi:hypothetical protein